MAEEKIRAVGKQNITQALIIHDYNGFSIRQHMCGLCFTMWAELFTVYEMHITYNAYNNIICGI